MEIIKSEAVCEYFSYEVYLEETNVSINKLITIHEFNQEMLEILQTTLLLIRQYVQNNNTPLPNSSTYNSLFDKAQTLIEEITQEALIT